MTNKMGEIWFNGILISAQANGHLECAECSTYWCQHIEDVVKLGLDADILGELLKQEDSWAVEWLSLEVPVVPTLNIWVPVHLKPAKVNNVPMFKVIWIGPNADCEDFLGFINTGEGRTVIRSMVFDFFNGTDENPSTRQCQSTRHGYTEEMRFKQDQNNQLRRFANQWTIWYDQQCLACRGTAPDDGGTAEDLIPDIPAPASLWRNMARNPSYRAEYESNWPGPYNQEFNNG